MSWKKYTLPKLTINNLFDFLGIQGFKIVTKVEMEAVIANAK